MAQAQAQVLPGSGEDTIVPAKIRPAIELEVNGERFYHTGDPDMPLLWYLRDVLQLTGTKIGSFEGTDGFGAVLLDGKAVAAIDQPMSALAGHAVTTVEGLAGRDGRLHPLQQAFIDEDAIGCGYCTSGWLITSLDLLRRKPQPTDQDIDQLPNRCRCGSQDRVRRAIKRVAKAASA